MPIVTPGLLICQALGVSPRDTNLIVSMSLVISGIATFVQCRRFGPFGAGLLIVQGTSFNFVGPLIAGGALMVKSGTPVEAVMAAIFGVVMAGSFVEMGVSRVLPFVKRLITPLVTGIVVLMIGLTLIKVGLISMGGGFAALGNGTFANGENLLLSGTVLATIVVLNRLPLRGLRSSAIVVALLLGYAIAAWLGRLNFTGMHEAAWVQIPMPLHFGLGFSWSLFVPLLVIYLVTSLEAIGDITATSKVSREPVEGPLWMQRIKGGVLINGANSLLAGLFNTFPSSVFAQNNGVIQLTGIASRHVGMWIAAILVLLGLFPAVAGVIQAVPEPVLGGAAMVMFGAVAASGINILASVELDRRALLIIACPWRWAWAFPRYRNFSPICRGLESGAGIRRRHRRPVRPADELVPAGNAQDRRLDALFHPRTEVPRGGADSLGKSPVDSPRSSFRPWATHPAERP